MSMFVGNSWINKHNVKKYIYCLLLPYLVRVGVCGSDDDDGSGSVGKS